MIPITLNTVVEFGEGGGGLRAPRLGRVSHVTGVVHAEGQARTSARRCRVADGDREVVSLEPIRKGVC